MIRRGEQCEEAILTMNRRNAMQVSLGALLALSAPVRAQTLLFLPETAPLEDVISAFAGDQVPATGGVTLTLPEAADDGFHVRVKIEAPNAGELLLIAPLNPVLPVLKARFGPLAGSHSVTTRMRLADTQEVLALARFPDGTVRQDSRAISVLVGGCA